MRRTTPARARALRVALTALGLVALIAFAAEPTTSTQFDVLEGRGVAVVQAAHQIAVQAHVSAERPDPVPVVPAVLSLLAVGVSAAVLARRAHDVGGRLPVWLGHARPDRRGPPALV